MDSAPDFKLLAPFVFRVPVDEKSGLRLEYSTLMDMDNCFEGGESPG